LVSYADDFGHFSSRDFYFCGYLGLDASFSGVLTWRSGFLSQMPMFHVEHYGVFMRYLILILLSLNLLACNKPDPNPENMDPIFQDMKAQEDITKKNIEDFTKQLEEHAHNIEKVKPQTGQIKYAEKRYWEARDHLDKLQQQYVYWQIRKAERLKHARTEYLKAFKEGKNWPRQEEVDEYMSEKRLRQAKQQWDIKERLQDYKKSETKAAAPKTEE
jgi:hypothetical protein